MFTCLRLKKTLFSTYCTLLLFLYALPFWNAPIFTKLIVLRSEACSDWPAIPCVVISRTPQAFDGNVTTLMPSSHCTTNFRLCRFHIARWIGDRRFHTAWLYNRKNRRLLSGLQTTAKRTREVIRKLRKIMLILWSISPPQTHNN